MELKHDDAKKGVRKEPTVSKIRAFGTAVVLVSGLALISCAGQQKETSCAKVAKTGITSGVFEVKGGDILPIAAFADTNAEVIEANERGVKLNWKVGCGVNWKVGCGVVTDVPYGEKRKIGRIPEGCDIYISFWRSKTADTAVVYISL